MVVLSFGSNFDAVVGGGHHGIYLLCLLDPNQEELCPHCVTCESISWCGCCALGPDASGPLIRPGPGVVWSSQPAWPPGGHGAGQQPCCVCSFSRGDEEARCPGSSGVQAVATLVGFFPSPFPRVSF